jgi:tricorn protease
MAFAPDGRTLYYRSGSNLYAASVNPAALGGGAAAGGGRGGRGGGASAEAPAGGNQTARQVTYTANIEIDRRALRAQVFNEGWRIMKNRFYDPKMHGVDWAAIKKQYEPLLEFVAEREELQSIMMMMIGRRQRRR